MLISMVSKSFENAPATLEIVAEIITTTSGKVRRV